MYIYIHIHLHTNIQIEKEMYLFECEYMYAKTKHTLHIYKYPQIEYAMSFFMIAKKEPMERAQSMCTFV